LLIETSEPRIALIKCIVENIQNISEERNITLVDYLKEIAIVIKTETIPANCIVLKQNQHYVFLHDPFYEEDLLEAVARIRLRHIRYYEYYNSELREVLSNEVRIFTELYRSNNCLKQVAL